mmetsp:Transcript_3370/g.5654  ORF Transcript_3370/g.5654 Transcript_3370/m.5654 type:complete len:85 (+) Transcript_3370:2571-2825(+)
MRPTEITIDLQDYQLSEIREKVELDQQTMGKRKRIAEEDYVMARQLLKNVEEKRLELARDYFEADLKTISRKMAIKSLKDRVED